MKKLTRKLGVFGQLVAFAREQKAYWLVPLVVVLVLVAALVVVSQGAAPFIYTLF